VTPGTRQAGEKYAQIVIGNERAAAELTRNEMSVSDRGIYGVSAEAGQPAGLCDAVRATAKVGECSVL